MHDDVDKALWDSLPPEDKNDFFPIYHYLKHIQRFMYFANLQSGLPATELTEKPGEDVDAMLRHHVLHVAETAPTLETSIYHSKVVTLQDAAKLVVPKEDMHLPVPEKVMPFKVAREVILKVNDTVAVGSCPCRSSVEKPCVPPDQQVCLFVGDPFASFIAEQNPEFRKISLDEAVNVLEFAHRKGFVHTAWFKKETSNRFHMLCACCSCCCLGIKMWNLLGGTIPILAPSGYVAEVNDDCNACAECASGTCHFNAISIDENKQKAVIDLAKCMGCGICVDMCPRKAIQLRREPSKGDPLDVDELKNQGVAAG
jgi:Pyruvate/2-oxoacid:ferredoxin oxidoreductase delta subunit